MMTANLDNQIAFAMVVGLGEAEMANDTPEGFLQFYSRCFSGHRAYFARGLGSAFHHQLLIGPFPFRFSLTPCEPDLRIALTSAKSRADIRCQ